MFHGHCFQSIVTPHCVDVTPPAAGGAPRAGAGDRGRAVRLPVRGARGPGGAHQEAQGRREQDPQH